MKTLTVLQAAALFMLAVAGAYAGGDAAPAKCPASVTVSDETCTR